MNPAQTPALAAAPVGGEVVLDPAIRALFLAYAEGFDDFDSPRVIDAFHFPATLWQAGRGNVFETDEDLAENVEALFDVFEREEIVRSLFTPLSALVAGDTAFVALAWRQERADGEAALEFSARYTLLRDGGPSQDGEASGPWRIALVVTD